uniref:Uncharacterized protein n=1 Tax=Oryza meridionalis TaxID=40149 RepID=A0A0E0DBC5_9ORYZ
MVSKLGKLLDKGSTWMSLGQESRCIYCSFLKESTFTCLTSMLQMQWAVWRCDAQKVSSQEKATIWSWSLSLNTECNLGHLSIQHHLIRPQFDPGILVIQESSCTFRECTMSMKFPKILSFPCNCFLFLISTLQLLLHFDSKGRGGQGQITGAILSATTLSNISLYIFPATVRSTWAFLICSLLHCLLCPSSLQ